MALKSPGKMCITINKFSKLVSDVLIVIIILIREVKLYINIFSD